MRLLQRKGVNGEVGRLCRSGAGGALSSVDRGGGFFQLPCPSCSEAASRALVGLWRQVELEWPPRRPCRWFESHT